MSGGGGAKQEVVEYYASIHYGVATNVDEFVSVHYGEKLLWEGSATTNQTVTVKKKGLFGGEKVEGGFVGRIGFMKGGANQYLPTPLWQAMGRNEAFGPIGSYDYDEELRFKAPAYRGIASIYVTGLPAAYSAAVLAENPNDWFLKKGWTGASIGHNTAYIKDWWFRARRAPKNCPFPSTITIGERKNANPAAIIWESMTSNEWGMGYPTSAMDVASFTYAANYLEDEGFGLSIFWNTQSTIEEFVGLILDHIEASLVLDPYTGTFRLTLVRNDYDEDDLPILTPENCTVKKFDRKLWGETMNEITVSWTNPENESEETVTVQNLGNIIMQNGAIVAETRTYEAVRDADLALLVAQRDLNTASALLATATVTVNRTLWRVLPGDVVRLQWPRGDIIEDTIMRVGGIDYGRPGDSGITFDLVEDVFGTPEEIYTRSSGSAWVDPRTAPTAMPVTSVFTPPMYFLIQELGYKDAEALDDTTVYDAILAAHGDRGISYYDVMDEEPEPNGDLVWARQEFGSPATHAVLGHALPKEDESVLIDLEEVLGGDAIMPNSFVWIGGTGREGEIALVTGLDEDGYTLSRGLLDTVPKAWPIDTPVWFSQITDIASTDDERLVGEVVDVRLLPVSGGGQLELEDAPDVSGTMTDRPHLPLRPANVRLDGELWPDREAGAAYPREVTWSYRDPAGEDPRILHWSDGSTTPPAGVTYRVRVEALDASGNVTALASETSTTSTSYTVQETDVPDAAYVRVTLTAQRGSLDAWQDVVVEMRGPSSAPTDLAAEYRSPSAPQNVSTTVTG